MRDVLAPGRLRRDQQWQAEAAKVLESIPHGYCGLDRDFRFTYANSEAERMFGLSNDQLRGKTQQEVFPAGAEVETQLRRAMSERIPARVENYYKLWDRWFEIEAFPTSDAGLAVYFRDITSHKAAEAAKDRFAFLVDNSQDFIGICDKDFLPIYVNRAGLSQVGLESLEEAQRTPVEEFFFPEDRAFISEEFFQQVLRDGHGEVETRFRHFKTGEAIWMTYNVVVVKDNSGNLTGLATISRNVTESKRTERTLRESEERFRHMADNAPVMIRVTEADGACSFLNRPWYEFTGQTPESGLGSGWSEAVHPSDRQAAYETFVAANQKQEPFRVEYRVRRKDGEYRWAIETAAPRFADDGRFLGFVGSVFDITERKQVEAALRVSEEQFRTLANSIPQLAWMARPDGYIFWYNQRWYDYTGTTLDQMKGWGWQSVHDADELPRVVEKFKHSLATGAPWEDTFPLRRHDGEMCWHLSRMLPLRDEDGQVVLWFGTNTDITQHREMEQALREADRRKDEFLAMLGHELRNPLAAISSGMNLLKSSPTEERRTWIEQMMDRQVQRLHLLVDDLLDVTRITQGKIQLRKERVSLREQFDAAAQAAWDLMEDRRHEFSVELPEESIYVLVDPARFEQIVGNLLTNAAKYTPNGGRITLSATREGEEAVIRCADNGVGMSADELESVFAPFVQLNPSLDRTGSGLGMGLNLVRTLTEMHGGTVVASSGGPGKGSEFVLRLPLAAEGEGIEAAAPGPISAAEDSGTSLQILLVDDNPDVGESAAMLLRHDGHQVSVARDGHTALTIAARERPKIVLLDLGMPGLNGYQIAERIRKMPGLGSATIVAISGYPPQNRAEGGRELFDAHLVKPIDYDQLLRLLQQTKACGPAEASGPQEARRILLIEDNEELALLTCELLRNHGHQVRVAFTGAQALEEASGFDPEVVFCDLHLPDQSGFDVARSLREKPSLRTLFVVGVTADQTRAYDGGIDSSPFDLFLSKPLAWPKVRQILRTIDDGGAAMGQG